MNSEEIETMSEPKLYNLMHNLALITLKQMPEPHKEKCCQFLARQMLKNGEITLDDCQAILEYEINLKRPIRGDNL